MRPAGLAKMDEFEKRFREAKNQNDPQLLSEAYSTVADAFTDAGDSEEAAKWRHKAEEQAAKVTGRSKQPRAEDLQSREANSAAPVVEVPTQPIAVKALEKLDSALWVATSAEYVACARQTFNLAGEKLDLALRDKTWTASTEQFEKGGYQDLPPAVMVNLDEGVWNNTPYERGSFSDSANSITSSTLTGPTRPIARRCLRQAVP